MTLPMASPSASPAPQSPSSVDGSNGPATPVSPSTVQTLALPPPVDATPANVNANSAAPQAAQPKRKPSRRANTAERRATHNAVERARRETLNGRFLVRVKAHTVTRAAPTNFFPACLGPRGAAPESVPDPPPVQVLHRQQLHRPHPRLPPPPPSRGARAPYAQARVRRSPP